MGAARGLIIGMAFAVGGLGCGGKSTGNGGPSRSNAGNQLSPGWYELQFTGARLDARRNDGAPWHTKAPDSSSVIIGGLIGLAAGNPSLGLTLGNAAKDPGGDPLAPAPFIDLKIEGDTYRVSPVGTTYSPNWKQPISIDARKRTGREQVIVQVRDALDDSVIAQHETTLAELLARPATTFTDMAPVKTLDLVVKPATARKRAEYTITVPSRAKLDDLIGGTAANWRAIPVWNGDTLSVDASGAVCPSSPSECFDPDGAEEGRWTSYSYDGFKDARHASLVAIVPGDHYRVGKQRSIKIEQSGLVLLFVNDTDISNNTGEFTAHVVVTPP